MQDSYHRHSISLIILHWLTVLLIVSGIGIVLAREEIETRDLRFWLLDQHRVIGIVILALVLLRLIVRLIQGSNVINNDQSWLLTFIAQLGHLALYSLMIVTPLLGWALTNAHGKSVDVFNLIHLPSLVAPDSDFADILADWHEWSAWTLVAIIVIHMLAAGWHYFIRRDGILYSMLPIVKPPVSNQS